MTDPLRSLPDMVLSIGGYKRSVVVVLATLALLADPAAAVRKITVINKCGVPINLAAHSQQWLSQRPTTLDGSPQPGHWQIKDATPYSFHVPDVWTAGTLWVQGGCDANGENCKVGTCGPCDGTQAGAAGPTLAEFTIGTGLNDFYDVSLVNGFNVPMSITPAATGCAPADCLNDILPSCPPDQQLPAGQGQALACASACTMSPSPEVCCTGQYDGVGNCPSSQIPFYDMFKAACRNSYIFAKDDYPPQSQTAVWSCSTALNADYEVIICPNGQGIGAGNGLGRKRSRVPSLKD